MHNKLAPTIMLQDALLFLSTTLLLFLLFSVQGGGIVKGPLMLELGVCPEVSAATSATMIMFTAGSVSAICARARMAVTMVC
jgi:uncharacterized membrane protein YfcA